MIESQHDLILGYLKNSLLCISLSVKIIYAESVVSVFFNDVAAVVVFSLQSGFPGIFYAFI